ncbi:MAG TPA: hypothetical protein VFZ59_17405 [Verrucomicrobiae bacterium]|nr:hypothetical protein [Verrucomicrobiae bacterium]
MNVVEEATNPRVAGFPVRKRWPIIALGTLVLGALVVCVGIFFGSKPRQPIRVTLGNGQFLQVDKVAYGTHHHFGDGLAFAGGFTRKLPIKLQRALGLDSLKGFELEQPALVMWLSAWDEVTGTNVDCGPIMGQLTDKEGEAFNFVSRSFGKAGNWRKAAVFYDYPRGETNLTLQVRLVRSGPSKIVSVHLPNPYAVAPANWSGAPLPQSKTVGGLEIVLSGLRVQQMPKRTGMILPSYGVPRTKDAWWSDRMRAVFVPSGKCLSEGKPATGWTPPEWSSEDRFGNKPAFPGTNEPVLKFFATVYPHPTNSRATQLLATLPQTDLSITSSNIVWNQTNSTARTEIVTLGLFQPGTHTFSNGVYQTSSSELPEPANRSLRGLAGQRVGRIILGSSGWEFSATPIMTPRGAYYVRDHSTPSRIVYLRALKWNVPERIGVRFRDDLGRSWSARAEPTTLDQIYPFYVDLPADATNVITEIVMLKPLRAEFLVDTRTVHKL